MTPLKRLDPVPSINGDDPVARYHYIEAWGHEAYNEAMREWRKRNTVTKVNGYDIRAVQSQRFGRIYWVDGLDRGHATLEGAKKMASEAPPKVNA